MKVHTTKSKIYSIISLGITALLLTSCAAAGLDTSSPEPETSISEIPAAVDTQAPTTQNSAATDVGDEAVVSSDPSTQTQQSTEAPNENNGSDVSSDQETSQRPAMTQGSIENVGAYIPFETFNSSQDEYADTNVVLFFNAVWCSTCKKARDNFEASVKQIPKDLTIVIVDFDNSSELRKKYGVTVQHTFIQIDRAGEVMGKWSGSVTVAEIVEQLS